MEPDLSLVLGLLIGVFAIPAAVAAISNGRTPRAAGVALILAGAMLAYAINKKEGGYSMNQIPRVVFEVIGRFSG